MPVKRSITVKDLDGNDVTEDWYFSLGRAETLEMDIVHDHDDVPAYLAHLMKDPKANSREILSLWKEMLFRSVGQREGSLLVKDPEILRKFRFSGAFEQLLGELLDEKDAGASFFVSIMPADVQQQITAQENKTYTKEEMLAMSDEDFFRTFGEDDSAWDRDVLLVAMRRKIAPKAA